jgi:hypothetical protein
MKKTLLLLLVCPALFVSGQVIPEVYQTPVTGFQQLMDEYPNVIMQQLTSGNWTNMQRFTHHNAPNIDRIGEQKTSQWEDGAWKDLSIVSNSFILDNQNKVQSAIEEVSYSYPTFSFTYKNKYIYTYDANDRISKITVQGANPANSNNFTNSWNMTLFYDQNGRRTHDSTYYYTGQEKYLQYYDYDNTGNLISQITLTEGDTISKTYWTWAGTKLHSTITSNFDNTADEWTIQNADTLEYNPEGFVSSYISWGIYYLNGNTPMFGALRNELYHYTTSGKLDETINKSWENGIWENTSKTIVLYNPQDKAIVANLYEASGAGWNSVATYKYLFDVPTGINDLAGAEINATIYPNPAKDLISISFDNHSDKIATINIYDINGKAVNPIITGDQTIDVSGLNNGLYYLSITTDNGFMTRKIAVQH